MFDNWTQTSSLTVLKIKSAGEIAMIVNPLRKGHFNLCSCKIDTEIRQFCKTKTSYCEFTGRFMCIPKKCGEVTPLLSNNNGLYYYEIIQ